MPRPPPHQPDPSQPSSPRHQRSIHLTNQGGGHGVHALDSVLYFNWSTRNGADWVCQVSFGAQGQRSCQAGALARLPEHTTFKDCIFLSLKLLIHSLQVCYQIISIVLQFIKNVLHIWSNQPEEYRPIWLSIAIPGYQLGNHSIFHLTSSWEEWFNHHWRGKDSQVLLGTVQVIVQLSIAPKPAF